MHVLRACGVCLAANLDELRHQDAEERHLYQQQIEELDERCQEKQQLVDNEKLKFMEFKKQVALGAVNSRSGKAIMPKVRGQHRSHSEKSLPTLSKW